MKTTVHVTFYQSYYADETGKKPVLNRVTSYKPSDSDPNEIYAGQMAVEILFPEPSVTDFVLHEVAALRRKQGELFAESTKLEERIQSLLCIEAPKAEVAE